MARKSADTGSRTLQGEVLLQPRKPFPPPLVACLVLSKGPSYFLKTYFRVGDWNRRGPPPGGLEPGTMVFSPKQIFSRGSSSPNACQQLLSLLSGVNNAILYILRGLGSPVRAGLQREPATLDLSAFIPSRRWTCPGHCRLDHPASFA